MKLVWENLSAHDIWVSSLLKDVGSFEFSVFFLLPKVEAVSCYGCLFISMSGVAGELKTLPIGNFMDLFYDSRYAYFDDDCHGLTVGNFVSCYVAVQNCLEKRRCWPCSAYVVCAMIFSSCFIQSKVWFCWLPFQWCWVARNHRTGTKLFFVLEWRKHHFYRPRFSYWVCWVVGRVLKDRNLQWLQILVVCSFLWQRVHFEEFEHFYKKICYAEGADQNNLNFCSPETLFV